jgi:hypothetical protein
MTFEADEPVFAMRAAATAYEAFPLTLYVLAEHRVDKSAVFGETEVAFADWLEPATLSAASALAPHLPRRLFLTKFREQVEPSLVNDDYVFRYAAQDEVYHETITRVVYDDYTWLGVLGLACCGLMAAAFAGGLVVVRRRRGAPGAST